MKIRLKSSLAGLNTFQALRLAFVLLMLTGQPAGVCAQKVFDFNPACRQAYREIVSLRLESGQKLLNQEKAQHPDNLIPFLLENYIDFFLLFFNEDPAEYKKRLPNREKRLALLEKGPSESPFLLFSQALVHFQWAAVRIKFGHNWDAGWEFRRSFLQVKNNLERFPEFSPNLMYNGAMQVAAGTIPDGYRWLSKLMGIKGTIKEGMARLSQFLDKQDEWAVLFRNEAAFYYCYLKFYIENDKKGVARFISERQLDVVNNHLLAYLAANLSLNSQQAQKAEAIITGRNQSAEYMETPVWDMEMGYVRLFALQPDAAQYLERFVSNFRGKFYVKDVLQKISWHYYLQNNMGKANEFRRKVLQQGDTFTEADKQAQREAKTSTWPNKLLLQVRLLNDGGYNRRALGLLHGKSTNDFASTAEKLEFAYRVGRLYDDLGADRESIAFYKQAIELGEKRSEYYAARAALQIGFICEQQNNQQEAINWFNRCLGMDDHDYKDALDQRAKAGLARCNQK